MEFASAQDQLDRAAPNARVALASGDYGPLVIDRPLTLDCNGASVWAESTRPSICVRSVDVVVENAVLQSSDKPADGSWPVVLDIDAKAGAHFRNVKLAGCVRGDGAESGPWIIPREIDLGVIETAEAYFTMDFAVPVPCRLVSRVEGIYFDPPVLVPGVNKVRFRVTDTPRDTILWGRVELSSDQFVRILPLHGRVAVSQPEAAGTTAHLHTLTAEQEAAFCQALQLGSIPPVEVSAPPAREETPPVDAPPAQPDPVPAAAVSEMPPASVRKLGIWENNSATEPWCPEAVRPHLGFDVDYVDDYQVEESASPGWNILAATRRGRMHAHRGTHREDAFHFASEKDFTIVGVSDGADACPHSRVGSELTCRRVVEALAGQLTSRLEEFLQLSRVELDRQIQSAIGEAVHGVCNVLGEFAEKAGAKAEDFYCTLLLGVLWLAGESPHLVLSQVGDGFLAAQRMDGTVKRYGRRDPAEASSEPPCAIPDADAVRQAQYLMAVDATRVDAFLFCTGGIEDPFYPIDGMLPSIFQQLRAGVSEPLPGFEGQPPHGPVIGTPEARERLAAWLGFEKKGENDDRTIVILHRLPSRISSLPVKADSTTTAPIV